MGQSVGTDRVASSPKMDPEQLNTVVRAAIANALAEQAAVNQRDQQALLAEQAAVNQRDQQALLAEQAAVNQR